MSATESRDVSGDYVLHEQIVILQSAIKKRKDPVSSSSCYLEIRSLFTQVVDFRRIVVTSLIQLVQLVQLSRTHTQLLPNPAEGPCA